MYVEALDLVEELSGAGGEKYEHFIHDLIAAEANIHGISPGDIDWDCRTNVPDGGCDIHIRTGHGQPRPKFIPAAPSMWSLKSGKDGTEASTIVRELTDLAHDLVRDHLKNGGVFVWCPLQPVSQPKRKEIYDKVEAIAQKLGFDASQVKYRWPKVQAQILEAHWQLILEHLPELGRMLKLGVPIVKWPKESPDSRGFDVDWVDFAGRAAFKKRIQDHLTDNTGDAVLHIAGLSGIGKTRTVVQACIDEQRLANTLYIPQYADLKQHPEFLRRVQDTARSIRMVIDEVPLTDYQDLTNRFRDDGQRIRIVTLGPAHRNELEGRNVFIMALPKQEEGVLQVVRQAAPELTPPVQQSIAQHSSHDLRLALLLVRAAKENPEWRHAPVTGLEGVWERVESLFRKHLPDNFAQSYSTLTVAIDVGHDDRYRSELEHVARHLGSEIRELDRAIQGAAEAGLGMKTPQFFEAIPRALAVWVFSERLWGTLSANLLTRFLEEMPTDRLRRRFIERCQEVREPQRKEVLDRIGRYFLTFLETPNLLRLRDRERSRVFEAWAELDPERGLAWLVRAAEDTTDEEIRAFDGSPDGSGGWRGRGQVVWLCEHLACFKEYFRQCERILFRLAQVETEESIGNNSRNTWKAMFLPVLSNTEVPFPERLELLLDRLRNADDTTINLLLSAAMDIFGAHGFRQVPPTVVGGRVVPAEWRPSTWKELADLKVEAGRKLLRAFGQLRPELRRTAQAEVTANLIHFINAGLIPELRNLLVNVADDAELLRMLRAAIDRAISYYEPDGEEQEEPEHLPALRQWRKDIHPLGLREQIIDLTARDYWSVYFHSAEGKTEDNRAVVFRQLAQGLLENLPLLAELREWFNSDQCRSGGPFGFELGRADTGGEALSTVLTWLSDGEAVGFVSNYLRATSMRTDRLPEDAVALLEKVRKQRPELAVLISIESDCTERGFERILNTLDRLAPGQLGLLRPMAFNDWPTVLSEERKDCLLTVLTRSTDTNALAVAFDLLAGWTEHGKKSMPSKLTGVALQMLRAAAQPNAKVHDYDWKIVIGLLADRFPNEVAVLLADTITDVESRQFQLREYAEEAFKQLAATAPDACMQAIGRWIVDPKRGPIFNLWEFRGLFDAISLETVKPWVKEHGPTAAVRIARHLDGPYLDDSGQVVVPPLADWLLTAFEKEERVLREFCMGRHSGLVRCGHAREQEAEISRLVAAFSRDHRQWVRELAKYERHHWESQTEWDDQRENEQDRL